jgi:hypothetical protein
MSQGERRASCCGAKRLAQRQSAAARAGTGVPQQPQQPPAPRPAPPAQPQDTQGRVLIQYTGVTPLTELGPITGATYRFASWGSRVLVDARDADILLVRRDLRRV